MRKLMGIITMALLAASLGWAQAEDSAEAPQFPDPPAQVTRQEGGQVFVAQDGMGMGGQVSVMRRGDIVTATAGPGMGMDMGMMRGPGEGKWWKNPELAQKLSLSDDQVGKMEKIFQDHRLQLIDLHASLEKQEVLLEPMINAEHPDEQQTLAQIDKVAQARADLEKSNARMLFAIRNVLTPDQWKKLQTWKEERRPMRVRVGPGERMRDQRFRMRGPSPDARPAAPAPPAPPASPNPPNQ
jgi:periplasmic protein CpxP/Spy